MSTVNYFEARRSNLAAFNAVRLNVSTITGSTIQTSATATTSSFVVSTITTQSGSYSTLSGSSLSATSLSASTLQIQSGTYSTLSGSSLSASSMTSNTLNTVSTITTSSLRTTGNVGIGTTNPSSLLTVHGGNTSTAITVANGFNAGNYSRYGLAYSASQYSNHSAAGDTVINSVGGNMILEAVNKNISLSVPNTVCPNLLTVSGTGSSQTSSTAGWGSLTNTFKYNSIALTWTAPVACYVSSVSMYLGQGNNGTNISMYVNGNFINEWWPFQGYGLYVINATGSSIANGSATTPTPFSAMGQTLLQPGQTLVIYVSTLQAYNYFYYGHDSTTGGIGFSVVYAVPKVDLSLSSSSPALSLGMMNVGVGTSAPLAVLDVNGSMRVLDKAYTALTSGTGVDIIYSGGGTLTSGTRGAGGSLTAAAMSYAASGHTWYVGSSAGTNAMTVASSGRLGVGTATPRRVVDIVGPPTNPFTYAPTQLSISDTTGSALMNLLIGVDGTSNYASIQSSQSGVGGRPLLLNASEGNVGVGTTNPAYPLDVYGGSTVLARLKHSSDYARFILEGPSGGDLIFKAAGSSKWGVACIDNHLQFLLNDSTSTIPVVFTSSGSVGIGITNPFSKLNIAGGNIQLGSLAEYENGTTCTEVIQFGGGYAANWTYGYAGIQGGCAGAGGPSGFGGILNFWTKVNNGSTYTGMTLNQGNVGVGTTTPSYALDVVGSSRVSGSILFGFGGTYAAGCIYTDSNWGCIIRAKTVNPAVGAFLFSNSADTHLMTITNSGFVGIGTDTPPSWGQTTICGAGNSVNSSNQLVLMNSTNNNMVLMFAMGTAAAYIQSYQQGTPGGSTLCLNQLGGNVAIGTTDPQNNKLRVFGGNSTSGISLGDYQTTAGVKYIGITNSADGTNVGYSSGFSGMTLGAPSDGLTEGYVAFHTHDYGINSDERMRINKSGYVGIGLTNPSYLLHVAGSLNCSSLYVDGVAITSLGAQWTESGSNAYYTAGSIGIGTTSPSNLLTVAQLGANYSAPVLVLDAGIAANASAGAPRGIGKPLLGIGNSSWTSGGAAGDYYGIGFGYGGAAAGSFYPAEIGLYVQTTSGSTWGDMVFSTRSTTANSVASERVRITGAGNVGIGTTNPSFPLSLVGTQSINGTSSQYSKTTSSGNLLFNTSSDSYAYPTINLFNYDHNNNGIFFDIIYTNPNWQNCTTGTNWGIYKTGGSLQFTYLTGTAGTTGDLTNAMVLTSSGVGIGTTNPSGTLHAYGNAVVANYRPYVFSHFTVSRSAAAASMAIVAGTETTTATLYLGTPLAPGGSASSAYKVCILANGNGSGSGWSTADLHFCLNGTTGGSSNDIANTASISDSKMVIKTYGNVGIGTVNPSAKLHVAGATFIQGPTVGTTATNVIGNFGLRISQLTSVQEIVGQIVGQMCFHGWGRPYASSFIRCITDSTNGYDDAGALVFGTSSAGTGAVETMRITEAGNVGIGTNDTQNNKLRVFGGNSISGISIGDHLTSAGVKYIGMTNPTNGTAIGLDNGFSGMTFGPAADGATSGYVALHTHNYGISSGERLRIDKSGNVGIGKTNPAYLLDVAGTLNCTGVFVNGSAFTGGSGATWTLSGSNAYYTAGNIGIGTASPTENLTVYGSAIGLRNSSIGVFSIGLATGSGQHSTSAVAADSIIRSMNGNLMLQTGSGAAALYINNSTNYVGIGTTTPSTALTVVGSMTTHGQLFAVGGNTSTYYPVLIDARPSWATSNTYKFIVSRSSVHMDATWKGATTIVVEGHNFAWGNGADYLKYKILGSTSGPVSFGNFVANIIEDFAAEFIIIYLRGATTYYFSGEGCLLNNANTSGATLTIPAGNNASYAATTSITAPFGSAVASGDFRDNIWSVGGNVGIGKSNPTQLLDVNGAINCTSFLVNGTAVATGTGSVWGVNGSAAYYTSGLVGIGTTNPITTNIIGDNGGTGIDVWSTTAFDAWAKIRILCNASQYGRTSLEMIGRWENNNDGWTLNGGRNNIVFGYQTSQGSAISYVNAIQSFNGQLGFFSSGYSSATPAMVLNASGYVGIGTASPAVRLHVFGNSTAGHLNRIQIEGNTSDVACLNLKTAANTSYIFTDGNGHLQLYPNTAAQHVFLQPDPSGKVAIGNNGNTPYGMLQVGHANTASGSSDGNIVFGKSTGSGYRYFKMGYDADFNFSIGDYGHAAGLVWTQQLKLAYSAPANCIVVASSGYVGIGIATPVASLHVYGSNNTSGGQFTPLALTNSNAPTLRWDVGPNVNGDFCVFYSGGGVLFINRNSVNGGWIYSSDLRLKDDIVAIPNCVDTIDALRPVSYRMKSNMDSQYKTFGLIAQEVKEVLPELVHSITDAEHGEIYGITYNGFIPILIGAVKELSAENATLHGTCATLKAENAAMKSQMASLSASYASLVAWAQTQGFNA